MALPLGRLARRPLRPLLRGASTSLERRDVDVAVVGAGFAGVYMVRKARELGLSVRCLEAAPDVGGTWYWNRYPGAKCDIDSLEYCYSWCPEVNQEWTWGQRYSPAAEIQAYIRHVAEKYDVLRDVDLETKVASAAFDEAAGRWSVATEGGGQLSAKFLVTAVGGLSQRFEPDLPGRAEFKGRVLHTQGWPQGGVDFRGRRVALVGVGSSGVQCIPEIAAEAKELRVLMRTPNFVLPAGELAAVPRYTRLVKQHYEEFLRASRFDTATGVDLQQDPRPAAEIPAEEMQASLEARYREGGFGLLGFCSDAAVNMESNAILQDFLRGKIREIVKDPATAEALCPEHAIMAKRPTVGSGFYEAFNRPNVHLVDLKGSSVEAFNAEGIVALGRTVRADDVVFATGFDSTTGALNAIDIAGRGGRRLKEAWREGPRSYLGLGCAGFPNLFTVTGPLSPGVLSNVVASIEQHVDWIGACLAHMGKEGKTRVEAEEGQQREWVEHANTLAELTVFKAGSKSSYRGSNIPGKSDAILAYPGGLQAYRAKCDDVASKGYEGFRFS